MKDSAEGAISGFLFQFGKALLILASLTDSLASISVENVDDIAVHEDSETEKVMTAIQAKHSLSISGTAFTDSGEALWRTIEIWIAKLCDGTFDDSTVFVCSSNKAVPDDALIRKIKRVPFEEALGLITELAVHLEEKEKEKLSKEKKTTVLTKVLSKINYALANSAQLRIVLSNLKIEDAENVEHKFLEILRLTTEKVSAASRNEIYQTFYGWLLQTCYAKWKNGEKAIITKQAFDNKWYIVNSSPQFVNAIFRKKEALGTLSEEKKAQIKDELFVRQIDDIERGPGKRPVLERAISDYIHHEIEMSHVVGKGDFTNDDFEQFKRSCSIRWEELFYEHVIKSEYTEEEMNSVAIKIFDAVMNEIQLQFIGGHQFDLDSRYIKNGSFLKLSNQPLIGWRPDWFKKYGNNDQ